MKYPILLSLLPFVFPIYSFAGLANSSLHLRILTIQEGETTFDADQGTALVGSAVEYPELVGEEGDLFAIPVAVDLSDSTITFDFSKLGDGEFAPGDFNGYVISDYQDDLPPILSVSVDEENSTLAVTSEEISVSEEEIRVDVAALSYNSQSLLTLQVALQEDVIMVSKVNEPDSVKFVWSSEWTLQRSDDLAAWEVAASESPFSISSPEAGALFLRLATD
ncbi:hypothetical protein [Pelagicoccus albus]|uniref:Uncharacterized protein n=1 Tax=Pelagicoccus albus TaxID=415222 RepID=A0A7X1EAD3_9BACT|nr:hypothetical protein [Pelagicoccus albus]MBC2606667.1 hypothetical protein [Pelagicoccus albus]